MNDSTKTPSDIPILREAVNRKRDEEGEIDTSEPIDPEQLENLRAQLSADVRTLVDELLKECLTDAAANLRLSINEQLGETLPNLIDQALQARLGKTKTD